MSAAPRRRRRDREDRLDVELAERPPAARSHEWMLRIEAAIFASARPVPREALVRLVGQDCRFDDLIADLIEELRGRPYDLALVAGMLCAPKRDSRPRSARRIPEACRATALPELTRTEAFALTAIAYLQPVTRGNFQARGARDQPRALSRLASKGSLPVLDCFANPLTLLNRLLPNGKYRPVKTIHVTMPPTAFSATGAGETPGG